jgi:hypothetical protein
MGISVMGIGVNRAEIRIHNIKIPASGSKGVMSVKRFLLL